MDKVEKVHELDQSPHAYTVVHGAISEDNKILIESIKQRHGYKGNLFYHLITLPSWVNSYTNVKRQRGRPKTQKMLYMKTMKAAVEAMNIVKYEKLTAEITKYLSQAFSWVFAAIGIKITNSLIDQTWEWLKPLLKKLWERIYKR